MKKKTIDKVMSIMETHPITRDCPRYLWLAYMNIHLRLREKIGNEAYEELKKIILNKNTPTFETLLRSKRKVEEIREDLRGENYDKRQKQSYIVAKNMKK